MRSRYGSRQLRHFAASAAALALLAACAPLPLRQASPASAAAAQPLARMVVATPPPDRDLLAQLLDAEFALGHSDLKTAARDYAKAAAISSDPQVAQRAAELAIAVHDGAAAEQAIARWQALGGAAGGLAEARAQLALDRGQAAQAQHQLELLVASGDADAWRKFGRILLDARDAAQAGKLLQAVATPARLPADPQAWLAMSELGDKLGRHAYAQQLATQAMRRFHSADTYAWAAQLKFKAGDHDDARKLYARAVALQPDSTRLRMGYASLLAQLGDTAAAARVLRQGPQDATTFAARAAFAARSKDKAQLRRVYDELQQAPDAVRDDSVFLLGQLADALGESAQALAWYAQVPDEDEHSFDADMRRVVLLHQQGKTAQAHRLVARLQDAYAGQPGPLLRAYRLDGDLYMQERDYARAAGIYGEGLALTPDDTDLLYGRGLAYAEAGNVDAANALGYTLADNNRDLGEAEQLIDQARSARPHDPSITDSWGWLQYRLGHLDRAEQALRTAWQERKDAEVGAHLAEVLWKQGQQTEARQVLAEARKLDPHNARLRATQQKIGP
ncbi:MAG TPA: tetratricopeptide repeat protein [Rhodanobacteraceae bacterium]|nr:tetratricopeptide repeat protein [Rhodanobacteraceae bacterium]